jgi:uncharacterized protein (TIGR02466 family)
MGMNIELHNLFPTPVIVADFKRDFSQEERDFFNDQITNSIVKNNIHSNANSKTLNSYILDEPVMENLKLDITEMIFLFLTNIYKPTTNILPYITQSWLTVTKENEYHHEHYHPNSFISGVLYIDTDETVDSISFIKPDNNSLIKIIPQEENAYNRRIEKISVKSGRIIIFPSSLSHHVSNKKGSNTRVALAFNSFIKGTLGSEVSLTELVL